MNVAPLEEPGVYEPLGIRPIINAAGNVSTLGGSVPSERTLQSMVDASRSFIDIAELQRKAHARLADITHNEAAYVTSGAAAGIYLTTAAAVSRHYDRPIDELSPEQVRLAEVVVLRGCGNAYDCAVRQVGVTIREADDLAGLERALGHHTAAMVHTPAHWNSPGTPSLGNVIELGHRHDILVLVDAAASIPPVTNLWQLTGHGADLAIFSGGKGLRGPQSTGLLVGRRELIDWVARLGFPRHGFGRLFKVGREEIMGLLNAVEQALERDEAAHRAWCEAQVAEMIKAFADHELVEVVRGFPNISGQLLPYALVRSRDGRFDCEKAAAALRAGDPAVAVGEIYGRTGFLGFRQGFIVNTLALREGEMSLVIESLRALLGGTDQTESGQGR